jgi:hypothetical protein
MKRLCGAATILAAGFAICAPMSSGTVFKHPHGCGAFDVPSHEWQQFTNYQERAHGTGWLLFWDGRGGSCNHSKREATRIIDHGAVPPRYKKDCDAEKAQTPGNWIEPFHHLTCHVRTRNANYLFQAFVDPTSAIPVQQPS